MSKGRQHRQQHGHPSGRQPVRPTIDRERTNLHVLRVEIRDEERKRVALCNETHAVAPASSNCSQYLHSAAEWRTRSRRSHGESTGSSSGRVRRSRACNRAHWSTNGSGRAAQDDEVLRALAQEAREAGHEQDRSGRSTKQRNQHAERTTTAKGQERWVVAADDQMVMHVNYCVFVKAETQ